MSEQQPPALTDEQREAIRQLLDAHKRACFGHANTTGNMFEKDIERAEHSIFTFVAALEAEVSALRHDLERSMANHVADIEAAAERERGLREALSDWKDQPCETTSAEDFEAGCCRACRARYWLSPTPGTTKEQV